jgi:hypothetical protein
MNHAAMNYGGMNHAAMNYGGMNHAGMNHAGINDPEHLGDTDIRSHMPNKPVNLANLAKL